MLVFLCTIQEGVYGTTEHAMAAEASREMVPNLAVKDVFENGGAYSASIDTLGWICFNIYTFMHTKCTTMHTIQISNDMLPRMRVISLSKGQGHPIMTQNGSLCLVYC